MSGERRAFIDSNVLLYLLSADRRKANVAEAIVSDARLARVISVQVIGEFVNVARNKARLAWADIRQYVGMFRDACELTSLDNEDHGLALDIAEQYRYRWYDSVIIASALRSDATVLLSEDLHDGQNIGGLVVENPLRDR